MSKLKKIYIELPPKWKGDNCLLNIPICHTSNSLPKILWKAQTGFFWKLYIEWAGSNDYNCKVIHDDDLKQPIEEKIISGVEDTIKWIKFWFKTIEEKRMNPMEII